MGLFDDDWPENNEPVDDTKILMTILYFSEDESKMFKKLCKKGIREMYGSAAIEKGNISDFLIKVLQERDERIETKTAS